MRNLVICVAVVSLVALLGQQCRQVRCESSNNDDDSDVIMSFDEFKVKFGKVYSSDEENSERKLTYEQNVAYVSDYNRWAREKGLDSRLGVNVRSDRFKGEISTGFRMTETDFDALDVHIDTNDDENESTTNSSRVKRETIPTNWDWRSISNRVNPVKDHGDCKADWAFAVTAAIETVYAIKRSISVRTFSSQQLLDCSSLSPFSACLGGGILYAARYAKVYGIANATDYPYVGYEQVCRTVSQVVKPVKVSLLKTQLTYLRQKIYQTGPVVVSLLASVDFNWYSKGMFVDRDCDNPVGYFSLAVIGYGEENSKRYWLLRNSMGTSWGISGYMKLPQRSNNLYCGVTIKPVWILF